LKHRDLKKTNNIYHFPSELKEFKLYKHNKKSNESNELNLIEAMEFLKLLNECKKENELLESRLCSLEASHAHLSSLNEQLGLSTNKTRNSHSAATTSTAQNPD